ncbi:exonuclease subunit SbcD [Ferrimonas lipolytica]|uniref:Nuclease SbcCD subunit D n=1 Tax=Ferrimonas lipolytica TaxID=2724191 RepID=A0A6H1UDJ2_9GAMM|nr:exonuclease subunit SbcD [Ferrimonas lipolytica]QIZ77155.1 exonuclease subunit SbcD [Ferrimonas lipolytica]
MRLLHTSDWHLGQYFYGKSRAQEHNAFIDWLLSQIVDNKVDALIVAGDLFDTGTPPSYARAIYNRLVTAMSKLDCQLVLLGGNHDSVAVLNESKALLAELGTHLTANASDDIDSQLVELTNSSGEAIGIVCAVPYLRPRDIQRSSADQSASDKQLQLQLQIAEHYQQLFAAAQQIKADRALPIIATGHLTTVGASSSDSVRDLYIGTLDAFPASAFPPADYVALGHIHRSQIIGGNNSIRYSGSPIPLSFDELGSDKKVLLVDVDAEQPAVVTELVIPTFQPMALIKGDLADIEQQLQQFTAAEQITWLDIEVQSESYLSDLQGRIETLCQELPVEALLVRRQRLLQRDNLSQQHNETLAELSVNDVFARRLAQEQFEGEHNQQRKQRIEQHFAATLAQLEQTQ